MNESKVKLELRIDWSEIDLFGHVNNLAILKYIQAARVNYLEKIGLMQLRSSIKILMFLAVLTLAILHNSCTIEGESQTNNSDLVIQAGSVCGWGAGTDSIKITKQRISYLFYIPRKSTVPQISKSRSVTESEWKEITSCIDRNQFLKLKYNSCNVCFDGCDEWISIKDEKLDHKITFGKGIQIDTISSLQKKLVQLRTEFGN
jgi:hypothetical protein